MKSILITGSNRGIGLGLVKSFLSKANKLPTHVIATCRNIDKAKELADIAKNNHNLHILQLDLRNLNQFNDLKKSVQAIVEDKGLNLLINNAGYSPKFTRIGLVKASQVVEAFEVNTLGPLMLTKTLLPLLTQAVPNEQDRSKSSYKGVVINMSSVLGSISMNKDGGLYPYRCSKAALNMVTRSLSNDLQNDGVLVVSIHPGWVKTEMGGTKAPMEVDDSANHIVDFIDKIKPEHNGQFYQYDGKMLEW